MILSRDSILLRFHAFPSTHIFILAFDRVVFSEEIGKIHGPVSTPFGEHLILIESRNEPDKK